MMTNIALPGQDRTRDTQEAHDDQGTGRRSTLNEGRGAGSSGWARTLTELGVGSYTVAYEYTFQDAIRTAARAMRITKRPVGLLVWGGKHAWVMTGFTSIGDPAIHPDFEVTGVRVLDPLYPRHNADLGPSPAAQLADEAEHARQLLRRLALANAQFDHDELELRSGRGGWSCRSRPDAARGGPLRSAGSMTR